MISLNRFVFFVCVCTNFLLTIKADCRKDFVGREWDFLHYQLARKPVERCPQFRDNPLQVLSILFISGVISAAALYKAIIYYNSPSMMCDEDVAAFLSIYGGFLGLLGSAIVTTIIDNRRLQQFFDKAFPTYVKKWEKNKRVTPVCFHQSFDELYTLYCQQGESVLFKKNCAKLRTIIINALMTQFPQYYLRPITNVYVMR